MKIKKASLSLLINSLLLAIFLVPSAYAAPTVGVAKQVLAVTPVGGGQYDVSLSFVVENLGDTQLDIVQVTDDLTATFPAPVTFAVSAGPATTGTLTANGAFNGAGDTNLLDDTASTLAIGATATITLTVRITPNGAAGPFMNSATALAETIDFPLATDISDDGVDPDPNGNNNANEPGENDPTPIVLPSEAPAVGLAKQVLAVTPVAGGQFDVSLSFVVENLGDVPLANVQVADDLAAAFPAPVTFAVSAGPNASGTLTANAAYDGSADTNLLDAAASTLAVGASDTIIMTVRVAPNGATGPFMNSANVGALSPALAAVTDASDDGVDPDPNGNGDATEAGENDPTPIVLPTVVISTPTLSQWGLVLLALLMLTLGWSYLRKENAQRRL